MSAFVFTVAVLALLAALFLGVLSYGAFESDNNSGDALPMLGCVVGMVLGAGALVALVLGVVGMAVLFWS